MSIDRQTIIESLSQIEVAGNEEGLIPAYAVDSPRTQITAQPHMP